MKKLNLSILALAFVSLSYGQLASFSENFDSYTAGDYIGVVGTAGGWTTWSGNTGGTEDAQIANDEFNSDSNSLYLYSNSTNGGPTDIVLAFGNAYDEGLFDFEMMMFVSSGADGYFNFQAEQTIGTTWAMEFYCENGAVTMSNTNGTLLTGTMPTGQWVRIGFHINLDDNDWEVFVDSTSIGSFMNSFNKVASLNLYPYPQTAAESEYWVDDIMWAYDTIPAPPAPDTITVNINGQTVYVVDGDSFEIWDGNFVPYGLEELDNEAVSLYPNPANDAITVSFGRTVTNMEMSLIDITGRQVFSNFKNVSGRDQTLDLSNIPSGIYVLKGVSKEMSFQKSLVIRH